MKLHRLGLPLLLIFIFWVSAGLSAQTDGESGDKSWTISSEQSVPGANPTRTKQTHRETGGKVVDTQSVQRLSSDGQYEPYLDTEKESVKVDGNTTRTVIRTYGRDPDGRKKLVQVTEEEVHELSGGESRVSRNTSNPDVNGGLQVVRREQEETRQTGANSQETTTTVLAPDANGRFVPAMQLKEQQTKSSDTVTEVRKSTLLPDANGKWQVSEVREGRLETNGKDATKSEQVWRSDSEGRLATVRKTVSRDSEGLNGEKRQTVEDYSNQVPGKADDTRLRLDQKVTTTSRAGADGAATTVQQTEQRDPSGSNNGMEVTRKTIDIVRPGLNGGTREQQRGEARDGNGNSGVVWIDNRQSSKPASVQVDSKPTKPR
jgi:hypothetical protein